MVQSRFDAVVQELSQDANQLRIKKLLVYACQRTWENDPARLEAIDLAVLVKDLLYLTPTLEQLQTYLIAIARTLSKPAEYTLVANAIAHHMSQLYSAYTSLRSVTEVKEYQQVAQQLSQEPEHLRIKKLIYCACKQNWENDPAVLKQYVWLDLVQELHQLTPTPPSLEATLTSIVRTLNRSTEYLRLVERVCSAFSPLYASQPQSSHLPTTPRSPVPPVISKNPSSIPAIVTNGKIRPVQLPINLADVRLEMMKYANPLRAKLLIYSLLHATLDHSPESWAMLKLHELDDLLRSLSRTYPAWGDLNAKLHRIARILPEPNQYSATAEAVLRSLKPYYLKAAAVVPTMPGMRQAAPDAPTELATSHNEPTQVSHGSNSAEGDPSEERLRQAAHSLVPSNR